MKENKNMTQPGISKEELEAKAKKALQEGLIEKEAPNEQTIKHANMPLYMSPEMMQLFYGSRSRRWKNKNNWRVHLHLQASRRHAKNKVARSQRKTNRS